MENQIASAGTWLSPFGNRHRLDYMITRLTDADHKKVKVDFRMPVGLSGFRDHRPLCARACTRARARWKRRQPVEEKQDDGTEHCLRERERESIGFCKRAPWKGEVAPSSEEPLLLQLRREVNQVVHSRMTTPDMEAEIVKRALDTCCTVPQRKARSLRFPSEILALVERKQRFLRRWRGAQGSVRENSWKTQSHRLQWSKRLCVHTSGENWRILLVSWNSLSQASEINVCHGSNAKLQSR